MTFPLVASKTTGLVPFASFGRYLSKRSVASVEPVPGRVRSFEVCAPTLFETTMITPTRTSQIAVARKRWRTQAPASP